MSAQLSPNPWSVLRWLALAVFPPLATILPGVQGFTHNNRLLTIVLIVVYEFALFVVYLVTKIWKQVEDPWTKQIADTLDERVRGALSRYESYYCRYFRYAHQDLDVKGMSTQGAYTLEVERIFVDLRVDPIPLHQVSANPVRLPTELQTGTHSIWEYLHASPCLVLLGAPGSGKTTLVKHLGLLLVQSHRPHHAKQFPRLLPIILFLREYSTAIAENPNYSLVEAVRTQARPWSRSMPPGWIERRLADGRCLILLDGVDEVADPTQRRYVTQWVERQMVAYTENRFVITSRPYGYRNNPLNSVTVLEAQPFTYQQITQFVNNWYLANEVKSAVRDDPGVRMRAAAEAQNLLLRLREKEALIELAVNPLLLTMIATVHRYRGSLPGARITLYKEICEVLLGKRQEARGITQDLRADQRQLVLQPLAYEMMLQGTREVPKKEACRIILPALQQVRSDIAPDEFLQSIENGSGLLLEREQGIYGFAHLTFQEYLAAMHIRESALEQELTTYVESSWWHETIRLYCAQADATPILSACLTKASFSPEALTIALECLQEARNVQAKIRQQLDTMIEQSIEDENLERRRVIAKALLSQRIHQMHPLNERISIDTRLVTCAEYQLFLDEKRVQGEYYQPDHWKDLSFPKGTGRSPVCGVRQSDARTFCTWLTSHNQDLWRYRLPRPGEWAQIAEVIWQGQREPVGFWAEEPYIFIRPKGGIPDAFYRALDPALARALDPALARALDLARARAFDLDLDRVSARALDLARALAGALFTALDLDRARALDLARANTLANALDLARALARDLDRDLARALARDRYRDLARALARGRDLNLDLDLARALVLARDLACDLARALALDLARARASDRAVVEALTIYLMLYLLEQRKAGKLPAFEGIMLVKERKEI